MLSRSYIVSHTVLNPAKRLSSVREKLRQVCQNRNLSAQAAAASQGSIRDDESLWVRSSLPDVEAVRDRTVYEDIWERALAWGGATAYECGVTGRKYTYNELYRNTKGFAASLIKAGITNNQIIGLVLPNIPEYPISVIGAWEAGCVVSPVNPAYTADEIKRQLEISGATCVITIEHFLPTVIEAKKSCPNLKNLIVIGKTPPGCLSFFEMVKRDPTGYEFRKGSDMDMLETINMLPFSSGTTGPPKGVMLTHSNFATNMKQYLHPDLTIVNAATHGKQERLIGILPFFHVFGSSCMFLSAMQGAHMVTLPKFEPKMFTDAIRKHRPTSLQLVTPLINFMTQSPDVTKEELRETHSILGAAAPIGAALIGKILDKAGKYIFFQEGYGMTELTSVTLSVRKSMKHSKIGSCGSPVSSTIVKVVDPLTGKTLGANERGELLFKGPQVMKGYYKNQKATEETIDSEGWLHSGDISYYDDSKHFYIVDRLKELIKVKGFQVAPSELEDLLRDHEDVADVAVIGVPSAEYGEVPRAYIVLKAGSRPSEDSIHSFLAGKVSKHKQLRGGIEFVETIPKAPSGKLLRRELMAEYKAKYGGS